MKDDIVPAKTMAASSTMICLQAPWSRAEMIFVTPTRETACIPTKAGKTINVASIGFAKCMRVGKEILDLDGAKALISALMSHVTYLESIP